MSEVKECYACEQMRKGCSHDENEKEYFHIFDFIQNEIKLCKIMMDKPQCSSYYAGRQHAFEFCYQTLSSKRLHSKSKF